MSIREFPANATCEEFLAFGGQPTPDSDISGLGVILAFTVSAYLTFFLVLISYFFGQVDASLLNTVDTHVFHIRPKRARAPGEATSKTSNLRLGIALRQAILALSDQQIVTGIAIMAAGFQGLRLGGIDSYHYQTVLYLAWMSSSVHLSALSILSPVLKIRPALKVWRLVGMLVLLVLLLIGLVPTVSNDWGLLSWDGMRPNQSGWGIPAICFWGETWGDGVNPDAVLGFLLLIISYGWKVGGVFPSACSAYRRWIVYPIEWLFEYLLSFTAKGYTHAQAQRKPMQVFWLISYRVVLAVWVLYFALFETLASFSSAVWISALGLIFGTLQIAIPRQQNQPLLGSNEDTWGFGQLVPLILLIQPLSAVWEVLIIDDESIKEERLDIGSSKNQDLARSASKINSPCHERRQSDVQYALLQHFASYTPAQLAKCDPAEPTTAEITLLGSRIFYLNVYLTQPAIIIASVLAYLTDADSIGYETSGNWLFTSWILAAYIGVAWLLTFCLSPWSVIGRVPKEGGVVWGH